MILVFGGAYQGKLDYAIKRFVLTEDDIYRCAEGNVTCPSGGAIVYEADKWILSLLCAKKDVAKETEQFLRENRGSIVICNDISCGVVPIDPLMRQWREEMSKFMGQLARNADEVVRVYCGIPTRLK